MKGTKMKAGRFYLVLVICAAAAFLLKPAQAAHYGAADSHHVWRDAGYWHEHNPRWVYEYHPEWVVDQPVWWEADYAAHPAWFDYPFWTNYPIWEYGGYDNYHVWHYAWW
jgi:hypothetical protein